MFPYVRDKLQVQGSMAPAVRLKPVVELDPTDPYDGLTSKQQRFVELSFSGLSDIEAYRQAYDCSGMTQVSIGRRAAEAAHSPRVSAKIRQLQDKRDARSTLAANLNRDWITQRIMHLAESAEKETVQLGALIALGKVVGIDLFRETTRIEKVERTAADIDRELEAQLKSLAKTIDATAVTIAPSKRGKRGA